MAPKTVSNGMGAVAPKSHSIEKAVADRTTVIPQARPAAPTTPPEDRGITLRHSRNSAHPAKAGTIAMLRTL